MNDELLLAERDGVFEVTFNRPEKYNAISDGMLEGLRGAIDSFASCRDLRVMLLRAVGKYFSAGVEINPGISPDVAGSTLAGDGRGTGQQRAGSAHGHRAYRLRRRGL